MKRDGTNSAPGLNPLFSRPLSTKAKPPSSSLPRWLVGGVDIPEETKPKFPARLGPVTGVKPPGTEGATGPSMERKQGPLGVLFGRKPEKVRSPASFDLQAAMQGEEELKRASPMMRGFVEGFDSVEGREWRKGGARVVSDAPVDEVGGAMGSGAFKAGLVDDPFSRAVRGADAVARPVKGPPPEWAKDVAFEEVLAKGRLKGVQDPFTRMVLGKGADKALEGFDAAGANMKSPAAKQWAVDRYSAVLRQMRGGDPGEVEKALAQMPKAREAWRRNLYGKLKGTEEWLKGEVPQGVRGRQRVRVVEEALQMAWQAKEAGDDMGAELASRAAWAARNAEDRPSFAKAREVLNQAKAWRGGVQPGGEDWIRAFNPGAVELAEKEGGELSPTLGGGRVKFKSPEEVRPGYKERIKKQRASEDEPWRFVREAERAPRTDSYGKVLVEGMPPEARTGGGKQPDPAWFRVRGAERAVENELVLRGMPKGNPKAARAWVEANAPELKGLGEAFWGLKKGVPVETVLEGASDKTESILRLLMKEGVGPLEEVGSAIMKAAGKILR